MVLHFRRYAEQQTSRHRQKRDDTFSLSVYHTYDEVRATAISLERSRTLRERERELIFSREKARCDAFIHVQVHVALRNLSTIFINHYGPRSGRRLRHWSPIYPVPAHCSFSCGCIATHLVSIATHLVSIATHVATPSAFLSTSCGTLTVNVI
jgi:hypothetical protein